MFALEDFRPQNQIGSEASDVKTKKRKAGWPRGSSKQKVKKSCPGWDQWVSETSEHWQAKVSFLS